MTQLRVRRLVVTDAEGSLAGIITQTQVLKMCDPKELHYVMRTMQLVIDRQKQELQQLNRSLEAKNAELNSLVNVAELTKVANRRQFNTSLQQEWQRLQKEQQPLSIILGDIDNFKKFNDTYGHLSGDRCLQEIAQLLVKAARCPQDLVARFGGEEFIMVLPETDAAGAETMAKTILRKIYQLQIPHATSTNGDHVSMSLGVATTMPSPERSVQDFLETVDRLLYRSKHLGGGTYSLEKLW